MVSKSVNDSFCYTIDHKIAEVSSLRTFCAGGDHAGPCSGDSGDFILENFLNKFNVVFISTRQRILCENWRILDTTGNCISVNAQEQHRLRR